MGEPAQAAEAAPTGGAGGGKSGGGGGDQTGGLGLGGDTSGMGGMDPGMGGGFDANTFASLSDPGAAGVQQQVATRSANLGQQPLTDQPGARLQQPQQAAQQAAPSQQRALTADDLARAIFHGPEGPAAGPSGTPGDATFAERFGASENPAGFAERFGASDPSNIYNNAAPSSLGELTRQMAGLGSAPLGGAPGLTPDQFNARFAGNRPPTTTGANVSQRAYPGGGLPNLPPDPGPAPMDRGDEFPNIDPSQNPSLSAPGTTYNPATDPSLSGATPPATTAPATTAPPATTTATPQVTPPGTPAPAGMAPQSPLEQLLSGLLSPLEHLIASMLGVNPRQLFPGFYNGPFNRPPGPGYFPPGTVGGRQIGAGTGAGSAGPPGPQSPQVPPRQMPGTPTPPQAPQPRAPLPTPDPRGRQRLPGPPYTASRADRPPPWYHQEKPQQPSRAPPGGDRSLRGGLPRQDVSGPQRASIRYNNPGAQYPSERAKRFGATGYGVIGGGHLIAKFPDAVHGAASNMDLFARKYTGQPLGQAGRTWTGNLGFGVPGYDPRMIVTKEMFNDPNFVVPFMKAIAGREAGMGSPLTNEQWQQAFDLYQTGGDQQVGEESQDNARMRAIRNIRYAPNQVY